MSGRSMEQRQAELARYESTPLHLWPTLGEPAQDPAIIAAPLPDPAPTAGPAPARLPEPPEPEPTDTAWTYGARVFCYVLRHSCTATLSDEQLEQALHTSHDATSADTDPHALDRINRARVLIRQTLTRRQDEQRATAPEPSTPAGRDRENLGPMAPLSPTPDTQPPGGQAQRPPHERERVPEVDIAF